MLRKVRYSDSNGSGRDSLREQDRRLDIHGFVDYYEALSIYSDPESTETVAVPREVDPGDGCDSGRATPAAIAKCFCGVLMGGEFLLDALGRVREQDSERLADELTALGNRILSANLVDLGEVESVRPALEEMRDFLTIGLQHLSGDDPASPPRVLKTHHVGTVFKSGFNQLVQLRDQAEQMARFPSFTTELLESPDREFVDGVKRFKPILWESGAYRNFQSLSAYPERHERLEDIRTMAEGSCGFLRRLRRPCARPSTRPL